MNVTTVPILIFYDAIIATYAICVCNIFDWKLFTGMVIWTADDLSAKGIDDGTEWNWILHSLFSKGEIQEKSRDMAGIVAGISVGCFVLGSFLGFAFGCAVMRKRMHKKGLRLPFQRDDEETDFHDDDNTL